MPDWTNTPSRLLKAMTLASPRPFGAAMPPMMLWELLLTRMPSPSIGQGETAGGIGADQRADHVLPVVPCMSMPSPPLPLITVSKLGAVEPITFPLVPGPI